MHDSLGQDLILIKNSSEAARTKVGSDAVSMSSLEDISGIATHAINEARAITANLRPVELGRVGLCARRCSRCSTAWPNIRKSQWRRISRLWRRGGRRLRMLSLFRVLQEVLNMR